MKLFGHPVHLMLIHFPAGLLPMECLCYTLFCFYGEPVYAHVSFFAMAGAVLLGWLAVITGSLDLIKIPPERIIVLNSALLHGSLNTIVLIGYSFFLYTAWMNYPAMGDPRLVVLIIKAVLIGVMIAGNYLGGNLIIKHKVGIEN